MPEAKRSGRIGLPVLIACGVIVVVAALSAALNPREADAATPTVAPELAPVPPPTPVTIRGARGPITVPGSVWMDGHDAEAGVTVQKINVWTNPERNPLQVAFTMRHQSGARVVDAARVGDRIMFEIESHGMRGWVSDLFVTAD